MLTEELIFHFCCFAKSSRPREFHPQPLTEPYVTLSCHTAPIIQPMVIYKRLCFGHLVPPILMVDAFSQNRIIQFLHSAVITTVSSLLQTVPPLYSALVFYPCNFRYLRCFPCHRNYRFSSSVLKPELCSRHLYSGYRPASKQVPSGLIPR